MPRIRFRIRTILLFIAAIAVLMAIPQITAQLASIRWFWLEWDGVRLWSVTEQTSEQITTHPPTTTIIRHSVKTEVPMLPLLALLRIVVAASLFMALVLVSRSKLKNRAKLRENATRDVTTILAWFHSCDSSDSWLNHFVLAPGSCPGRKQRWTVETHLRRSPRRRGFGY